jgi:AraC-like DNA-binding protein
MMSGMSELSELLRRYCHSDRTITAIPRVTLSRSHVTTSLSPAIYYPLLCVIAQGRKRVFLGNEEFHWDATSYLVVSVDLPVSGQVLEAPCLCFTLALDVATLAALLLEMPPAALNCAPSKAMAINKLDDELLDPVLRLIRLLDKPEHIPIVAPLIEREILYRLLLGPRGEMLRQLALPASRLSQIRRAIDQIRSRFDQPLRVEELARAAGMSQPSFHRHFRAVTAMSPLQFHKQVRLQEARRRLLSQHADAARIGFEVGYESASQFSREYSRLFSSPPGRNARRLRPSLTLAEV